MAGSLKGSTKSALIIAIFVAYHANAFASRRVHRCTSSIRIISHQQQRLALMRQSSRSFHKDNVDESSTSHHHDWFDKNALSALQSSAKKATRNAAGLAATAVLVTAILSAPVHFQVLETFSTTTTTTTANIPRKIVIVPSQALALTENQMLVDNVWKEVTRQFVDQSFNGLGEDAWRKKRLEAVMKAGEIGPDDQEEVYEIIRKMLGYLGDPYTRFLSPEQFETLTSFAKGTNTKGNGGIGVQLIEDPATGRIIVLNTIPGSPAEKGGLRPGDVIFEVDYMDMESATAEVVAAKCRGDPGTEVSLAVRHGGDGKMANEMTRVALTRQVVKPRQVETSTIVSDSGKKIGVIQIPSFSLETEKQIREALGSVKKSTSAIAIDLRGNVGGYMPAGVDVAKLFLSPQARIVSEVDKSGRATIYTNDGVGSDTNVPLYVLVDKKTASASEIFAAALQDNHRATIVGTNTFGKGRIQNVQEIINGCGVAVTKAKYFTPNGKDIQGKGIAPDIESALCSTGESVTSCLKGIV